MLVLYISVIIVGSGMVVPVTVVIGKVPAGREGGENFPNSVCNFPTMYVVSQVSSTTTTTIIGTRPGQACDATTMRVRSIFVNKRVAAIASIGSVRGR